MNRLLRFVLVGGTSSGLHWLTFTLAVRLGSAPPLPANLVGLGLGIGVSYLLNSRFTFGAQPTAGNAVRFVVVTALGGGLNTALTLLLLAAMPPEAASALAIGVAAAFNFVAHQAWTFRSAPEGR